MTAGSGDKAARVERVAEHTARLVLRHGLDAVTHSRLSRAAGVSRPWLYKYVGRERSALVGAMVDHFGMRLAELDARPRCDTRQHWAEDSVAGLHVMIAHTRAAPWVLPLYFRHVGAADPIGERIAEIERRYLETASAELVRVGVATAQSASAVASLLHSMRLGLVHRHQQAGIPGDARLSITEEIFRRWLGAL